MIREFFQQCQAGDVSEERRSFELVRRLKAYYDAPNDPNGSCRRAVEWFCEQTGHPFLETWTDVNGLWNEVQFEEDGNDGFEWASQHARQTPIDLTGFAMLPEPGEVYQLAASLATYLSAFTRGKPFLLLVDKVGPWLGYKTHKQFSRFILPWLKQVNIVKCVCESFRFGPGGGRGKLYALTEEYLLFIGNNKKD